MKLRELLGGLKNWVFKHESCVCAFLAATAIMMGVMFWQSTDHMTEEIQMMKKHSIQVAEMEKVIMERNNVILQQGETIKKYETYLQNATKYIQKQDEIIKKLVEELNRLTRDDFIAEVN